MAELVRANQLRKELSLFNVYTIATGATLSSGFFLLPGLAADMAGPAVVVSYLLAVVPLLPGILCKVELATAMPRAGGEYYFIDRSLGPLAGTICGLGTWLGLVLKTAFALVGIGAYLHLLVGRVPITWIAGTVAVLLGVLNLFGARRSSGLQAALVIGLLVLLTWFCFTGVGHIEPGRFNGFFDRGAQQIFAAAGLVCVSFMGLTKVASVAEEVSNPERNLTLGILAALGTAIVVYGIGTAVIVGIVPPEDLYGSLTPVADAALNMVGPVGTVVMTVAAILAFISVANAGVLSASRYPLAMARDHLLPRWFRALNAHQSPHHGVIVTVGAVLLFVTVFDPTKIAKLASAFLLMLFALNCLAVLVMRESRIESYDPGYRTPWYPWIQIAGIVAPLGMILVMGSLAIAFTAGLIALGAAWYFRYARPRVRRGGAVYHLMARLGQRRFEGLDRELRGILKEKGLRAHDPYDQVVAQADVVDVPMSSSFEQITRMAADCLAKHLPLTAEQLTERFMEGTRVGATPVTGGVALPHLRMPDIDRPHMVLARASDGVEVDVQVDFVEHTADQQIYAVIFLVSPEHDAAQHLRMLAQVAQHLDDEAFMQEWLTARSAHHLKQILLRDDRFMSLHITSDGPSRELIDRQFDDVDWPEGLLIAMIHRDEQPIIPSRDHIFSDGDRLTIVGIPEAIARLQYRYNN